VERGNTRKKGTNMETVRLYDPDTNTMQDIPARELSSDCLLVHVPGLSDVYVEAQKLKAGKTVRHQELPEELRQRIRRLHAVIKDLYQEPLEEWEEGFKHDARPDREVAVWERIAETFRHFSKGGNRELQNAVFEVARKCSAAARPDEVPLIVSSATLSLLGRDKVEEIVAFYVDH
jgi:hypothetical protein